MWCLLRVAFGVNNYGADGEEIKMEQGEKFSREND